MDTALGLLPLVPAAGLLVALGSYGVPLWGAVATALAAFGLTDRMLLLTKQRFVSRGFSGKDLCKKGTARAEEPVPEATGIVPAVIYLCCLMLFQVCAESMLGIGARRDAFYAAMLTICFMTLLGFMDDTLDLPWRVKIFLPAVGCGPLLSSYTGSTALIVPTVLRFLIAEGGPLAQRGLGYGSEGLGMLGIRVEDPDGALVELGHWFYLAMGVLAVFCANAINIYAGVNGIEAGQSYILGVVMLTLNLLQILTGEGVEDAWLSAALVLPFVGVTAGLLRHNFYPATVFVGDCYCYFAGMTIAVCAIHGHYAKTLILFLIPQLFNFVYSLPQLFKLAPCPRHRLPRVNEQTQLLHPSTFPLKPGAKPLVRLLAFVSWDEEEVPNFTILCLALRILGPLRERTLVIVLLALQFGIGLGAIALRYSLSGICYDKDGGYKCD